jgi:hypothetical protein
MYGCGRGSNADFCATVSQLTTFLIIFYNGSFLIANINCTQYECMYTYIHFSCCIMDGAIELTEFLLLSELP